MTTARAVTLIPATLNQHRQSILDLRAKRRVAGYARVSTDNEEQLNSYQAQVDFYTNYIKERADWEFIAVYADEGISATSTKKRDGFNNMIADALDGKIDLIVTKSVSRFARNTVDTLITVRQLKEKGVEVYFEKENIYTLDSKGELLITIMSSLAQEESRSISENCTWGQRKRFADGKVSLPYSKFLGYEKGEDGLPKIVESEAVTVRLIYTMFLQGKTINAIARYLTAEGIPTPAKKVKWNVSTVMSILQNEKYKGDALLQKAYTVDFLTKKTKKNEGEVPQYYVENSHPAIVQPEVYDLVQVELKKRKATGKAQSGLHTFSNRIVCGHCGSYFGPKVLHSNTKYRRTVWRCNGKYKKGSDCKTPYLNENAIQKAFVDAFNQLYGDREQLMEDYAIIISVLTDTAALEKEAAAQQSECDVVMGLIRKSVDENARYALDQDDYNERHSALITRYEAVQKRIVEITEERKNRITKRDIISRFVSDLEKCGGLLTEFDEGLWGQTVEAVTVYSENDVAVIFRDGSTIHVDARENILSNK